MEGFIANTPEQIAFVVMLSRRGALRLEMVGLKRRGRSAYSICKSEYGLKGNRASVLAQMDRLIALAQVEAGQSALGR